MARNKDQLFTGAAILILLATAMIDWTIYSWLVLAAIILLLIAWYFRKK